MKILVSIGMVLLLAGCGSSVDPDYYNIAAVPGTPVNSLSYEIEVQRPSLARYLDRPDIVRQIGTYQMNIDEAHEWTQTPDKMVEAVLAEDLQQRLPSATITTESGRQSASNNLIIETDIFHFNAIPDSQVVLQGTYVIRDKPTKRDIVKQAMRFTVDLGMSATEVSAAMSVLVAKMADQIVSTLAQIRDRKN